MLLSVLIPAYNEQGNVARFEAELFPALDRLGRSYEVVVVDDGSSDSTAESVRKLCARRPEVVRLVQHPRNLGLGAAVRTAIAASRGELAVTLDADLTFHPAQIVDLMRRFDRGDADCVIGSPHLAGYGREVPRHRILLSRAVNLGYGLLLGQRLSAASPIFRLYRSAELKALKLESKGFEINAEILARLLQRGSRVAEVPARLTTRLHGVSKLNNAKEIRNHLRLLARVATWRWRG